jgi:hypothetical protein
MRISTLPLYLIGKRSAIVEVAQSPLGVVCGILFVISAGFAREYDGEDLVHEPWHILRPLAASLATGTILFYLIHAATSIRRRNSPTPPPKLWQACRSFMGLFWMTAPLAWFYAIPYEQFFSPVDAVRFNLWTLHVVAAWRVLLITRVISVVYKIHLVATFFIVMLFADALVFAIAIYIPAPVMAIMGGIRHSPEDALLMNTTTSLTILSVFSAPIWIIGALISLQFIKPAWPDQQARQTTSNSRALLVAAVVSLFIWTPLLIANQPAQMRRREADQLLRAGKISQAFQQMSAHQQEDYPSHWNPLPRIGYRDKEPSIDAVILAMRDQWPTDWVADIYLEKIRRVAKQSILPRRGTNQWSEIELLLEEPWFQQPDKKDINELIFLYESDPSLTETDREALAKLFELAQTKAPDNQ